MWFSLPVLSHQLSPLLSVITPVLATEGILRSRENQPQLAVLSHLESQGRMPTPGCIAMASEEQVALLPCPRPCAPFMSPLSTTQEMGPSLASLVMRIPYESGSEAISNPSLWLFADNQEKKLISETSQVGKGVRGSREGHMEPV